MSGSDQPGVGWGSTSWEGNRRERLRRAQELTLRERLQAVEEMTELTERLRMSREGGPRETNPMSAPGGGSHELPLAGCSPDPLMSYLKALGVLRLVSEQRPDWKARGWWEGNGFVLRGALDEQQLIEFLVHQYEPTPIVVPWSGSDFFTMRRPPAVPRPAPRYATTPTGARIIEAFLACESPRLACYHRAIAQTLRVMDKYKLQDKDALTDKRLKAKFIAALRNDLDTSVVKWIDAAAVIDQEAPRFSALLGSGGGSDGNTHFSDNFMQNLWDVLPDFAHQRRGHSDDAKTISRQISEESRRFAEQALFGHSTVRLIKKRTSSLFDSGAVGGPNATQGFERASLANPWNVILTLEGSICLAGALGRKFGGGSARQHRASSAFPFQFRTVVSAANGIAGKESGGRELWLPLWRKRVTATEMMALLAEGRADWNGRPARNTVDMARAVVSLGVDRGIDIFQRYAVVRGRVGGDNYHTAASMGGFEVASRGSVDLLREIDAWLDRFRRACADDQTPPRFSAALGRIDDAIVAFCRQGGPALFQGILLALGRGEMDLAAAERFRSKKPIRPLPLLSREWVGAADDGSLEFELARALATVHDAEQEIGSIRCNLEPVQFVRGHDGEHVVRWADRDRAVVWNSSDLAPNLANILARRLTDGARAACERLPLAGTSFASLEAVARFLDGETDDRRLADLLWGLVLVRRAANITTARGPAGLTAEPPVIPRVYALLKLLFLADPIQINGTEISGQPEPAIVSLLTSDRIGEACRIATRRLRASGLIAMPDARGNLGLRDRDWDEATYRGVDGPRLAAALLVPIAPAAVATLRRLVLRETQLAGKET